MPLTVHPKSKAMMKVRLKELTSRSNGWGYAKRKQKLEEYIRGCGGYNHLANMKRLQDGQSMGAMEKFVDVDEAYAASKGHKPGLTVTGHLFRALPSSEAKSITVEFTNRFGERYEQTVMISNPEVQTQVVAHRGYWDTKGSAQNSIASLRKAADAKVYGSECDVHITADSVIIVNHDPKINDLVIADSKYADLKIQLLKNGEEVSTLEQL